MCVCVYDSLLLTLDVQIQDIQLWKWNHPFLYIQLQDEKKN